MSTIFTRLYSSERDAKAVVAALKEHEYLKRDIDMVSGERRKGAGKKKVVAAAVALQGDIVPVVTEKKKPVSTAADIKKIKDNIRDAGVYPKAADTYATHVANGDVLVVLRAPVGQAVKARAILEEHPGLDAGVKYEEVYTGTRGYGTSSNYRPKTSASASLMTNQRIFTDDGIIRSGTPFSSLFGLPLLTSGKTGKAKLMTKNTTPFSNLLGWSLLSSRSGRSQLITKNTTPFSNFFGLPLLTGKRR